MNHICIGVYKAPSRDKHNAPDGACIPLTNGALEKDLHEAVCVLILDTRTNNAKKKNYLLASP